MILVGLTGSIATGKSHVARLFRALGVPVFDADAAVHRLMAPGGAAVRPVGAAFPGVVADDGSVDRKALGAHVFADPSALRRLESIVHPLVAEAERRYLATCARNGDAVVVLDIPLLYETGGERRVDLVVAVGCSDALQAERALRRPGMTMERLERVRRQQLPTPAKRRLADVFIPSGHDRGQVQRRLVRLMGELAGASGSVWPGRYAVARRMMDERKHA